MKRNFHVTNDELLKLMDKKKSETGIPYKVQIERALELYLKPAQCEVKNDQHNRRCFKTLQRD